MRWFGRLRRTSEIAYVRRRGRATSLPTLAAYRADANGGGLRVGVTVAKTVGGAVVRNAVRRRIRGALEAMPAFPGHARLLFIAKPAAALAGYAAIERDVAAAVSRLVAGS